MLCRARSSFLKAPAAPLTHQIFREGKTAFDLRVDACQRGAASQFARPYRAAFFSSTSRRPFLPPPSSILDGTSKMCYQSKAHASMVDSPSPKQDTQDAGEGALRFEAPRWVAIASDSGHENYRQLRTPVIDMTEIKGLDSGGKEREDAAEDLHTVMANVDPNTEILHITGDSPTDDQWEALGRYFTNVRYLKVFTGWDEEWIDAKFPLNWPLELLLIGDAGGERVTTPVILEGRVKHLVLCYTYNLRFEGPTTKELMKNAEQIGFISREKKAPDTEQIDPALRGEEDPKGSEPQEAQPDGIKIYSAPHEWKKWFISKYAGKEISLDPENPGGPVSAMRKLEILGNDAIDMFTYIALTKFHLLAGLESLTVYSLSENDLFYTLGAFFLGLPRHLDRLRHFRLILGSPMVSRLVQENEGHPFLAALLPPNLETLQFRGPVSMASHLEGLAAAFADKVFLPSLKRVSLVLDLPDKTEGSKNRSKPSLDELRVAKEACTKVLDAAARRGVVVEQFREPWVEEHPVLFHDVDKRWAEIEPTCY